MRGDEYPLFRGESEVHTLEMVLGTSGCLVFGWQSRCQWCGRGPSAPWWGLPVCLDMIPYVGTRAVLGLKQQVARPHNLPYLVGLRITTHHHYHHHYDMGVQTH